MNLPIPRPSTILLALQGGGIAMMMLVLPFLPPADGRMMLIPIGAESAAGLTPGALAAGARLIDRGPLTGSLVVRGERARLAQALGAVIILAAPQSGCGASGRPA